LNIQSDEKLDDDTLNAHNIELTSTND